MKQPRTLSERKRAAILEAALAEFRDKGFRMVSMDALSERAGVSKRTVYNHFASKEALFTEIARELLDYHAEATRTPYSPERPLEIQLRKLAEREISLLRSEKFRDLAKVMIGECIHSPELASAALEQLDKQEQGLEAWIDAAVEDGRLKQVDSSYAAAQFLALIKSSTFWPQLLMGQPFPDEAGCRRIVEDSVGMFLGYYARIDG